MPETTLAPAISANANTTTGDARVGLGSTGVPSALLTSIGFGHDNAVKNSTNYGYVSHYDTSSIPLDAEVTKAKLEMKASDADSVATAIDIDVLALNVRLNQNDSVVFESNLLYEPQNGAYPSSTALWSNGNTTTFDNPRLIAYLNIRHGLHGYAQAWTADNASGETLDYHWFRAARVGNMTSLDTYLRANVYTATGSAGSYQKGTLVDTGVARSLTTLPATTEAAWYCAASGDFTPTHGTVYITEIVLEGEFEAGTHQVRFRAHHAASNASTENMLALAHDGENGDNDTDPRKLQGFGGVSCWRDNGQIQNASIAGSGDANQNLPAFTANTVYALGDANYDTDHTLANFRTDLSSALGARTATTQWVGVRLQDFTTTTSGAWRRVHTSSGTTETRDSLKGVLLTLTWHQPQPITVTGLNGTVEVTPQIDREQTATAAVATSSLAGTVNDALALEQSSVAGSSTSSLAGTVNDALALEQTALAASTTNSLSGNVNAARARAQSDVAALLAQSAPAVVTWAALAELVTATGTGTSTASLSGSATSTHALLTGTGTSSVSISGS